MNKETIYNAGVLDGMLQAQKLSRRGYGYEKIQHLIYKFVESLQVTK